MFPPVKKLIAINAIDINKAKMTCIVFQSKLTKIMNSTANNINKETKPTFKSFENKIIAPSAVKIKIKSGKTKPSDVAIPKILSIQAILNRPRFLTY